MKMRRFATSLLAVTVVSTLAMPAASAATDPTDISLTGGDLTATTPTVGDFAAVTLDGTAKSTTAAMGTWDVTDARGTGLGWNLTFQATQFAEWDSTLNAGAGGYVTGGKKLAASSLKMPVPSVLADGTLSALPTILTGPYTLDSGSAVKVASAALDAGMGNYDFTPGGSLTLTVPANAYARTYRSEVTVSVVSGP
ncbi:MAG: WxL domain-containing protein [Actinomycetota bacterium]|nr:WxL domain-containing protein [Actinomycetota bacterium]